MKIDSPFFSLFCITDLIRLTVILWGLQNKSSKNIEGEMKSEDQQLEKEGGTHKQDHRSVVLKVEFHCEGCVRKILKAVRSFKGKFHYYAF